MPSQAMMDVARMQRILNQSQPIILGRFQFRNSRFHKIHTLQQSHTLAIVISNRIQRYTTDTTKRVQGEWRSALKQLRRDVKIAESTQISITTLQGSQKVVALAILSNGIMFTGKMMAAVQSGSASMFSEALHSLADVFNECLLMWGIRRSLREPGTCFNLKRKICSILMDSLLKDTLGPWSRVLVTLHSIVSFSKVSFFLAVV